MKTIAATLLFSIGCAAATPAPAAVRLNEDACAYCRMTLVSVRTAAQIIAPGEEPLIFDELGCLRDYLAAHPVADNTRTYVADHRSGAWIDASSALFTQTPLTTPMSSGLIAHGDAASRDADPDARDGQPVSRSNVIPAKVTR
jgi:copper chaperone NosL